MNTARNLQNLIALGNFILGILLMLLGAELGMPTQGLTFIFCCSFVGIIYTLIQRHTGYHIGAKHAKRTK